MSPLDLLRREGVIFASHNPSKIRECRSFFAPYGIQVQTAADLGLPPTAETGTTFEENARLKADDPHLPPNAIILADDSGLCVHALSGAPGVYSARYAGQNGGYDTLFQSWAIDDRILADGSAYLTCTLVLRWPHGEYVTAEGRVHVRLSFPPTQTGATCYDPILRPVLGDGTPCDRSFAQMDADEKNMFSHRGRAFRQLADQLGLTPR